MLIYSHSSKEQRQLIFQKEFSDSEYPYSLDIINGVGENPIILLRTFVGYDFYYPDISQGIISESIARDMICGDFRDEQKSGDVAYFGNFMKAGCNQVLFRYFPKKPEKPKVKFYLVNQQTLKNDYNQPLQKIALSNESLIASAFVKMNNRFYFADFQKQDKTAILIEMTQAGKFMNSQIKPAFGRLL